MTATKRETSLERTPIAISAFGQSQLDKQQVKDVTGLADFVPSLHFAQQGDQGGILLTMRGIGNDSAYTEVADPEVAIYVNGIYSPRAQGASVLLYDMERVEVLRGPQGTLFGRNATVGAINMVTAKPTFDDFHASVEAVGGSYNRFGMQGMVNVPGHRHLRSARGLHHRSPRRLYRLSAAAPHRGHQSVGLRDQRQEVLCR